jgi:DNA-binding transcriptional MocR family regulator
MSIDATRWAWTRRSLSAAQKLVLLSMADRASGDDLCWPSKQTLADDTGLDRKTVFDAVAELESSGLIERTEERRGATGQVVVYRLLGVPHRVGERVAEAEQFQKRNSTENGMGKRPENGTVKRPKNGTQNLSVEPTSRTRRERATFVAPSPQEVAEYALGLGYSGWDQEAVKFVAFYGAKGWMVGRNPMRDWKAAVVGWQARRKSEAKSTTSREVFS